MASPAGVCCEPVDLAFEDALGLPRVERLASRRHEAAFYGAMTLLAEQAGVRYFDPDPPYLWLHGVKLPPLAQELEKLLGYFYSRPFERILVHHDGYARVLAEHGLECEVIGAPFVYAMGQGVKRRPGSLLVVPAHSLKNTEHEWPFEAFAEQMATLTPQYSEVVACIHPACWEKGYWIRELARVGIRCVRGADSFDKHALRRMAVLFESFETVLTNVWGSHIPYAAACGARVCLFGEYSGYRKEDFAKAKQYQEMPSLLDHLAVRGEDFYLRACPWLARPPMEAVAQQEWGLEVIGAQFKQGRNALRKRFGWGWRSELAGWLRKRRTSAEG